MEVMIVLVAVLSLAAVVWVVSKRKAEGREGSEDNENPSNWRYEDGSASYVVNFPTLVMATHARRADKNGARPRGTYSLRTDPHGVWQMMSLQDDGYADGVRALAAQVADGRTDLGHVEAPRRANEWVNVPLELAERIDAAHKRFAHPPRPRR